MQAEGLRQDLRQRDARVAELEQRLLQTAGACRRCRGMHGWQRRDDSQLSDNAPELCKGPSYKHPLTTCPNCSKGQPITGGCCPALCLCPLLLLLEPLCRYASLSQLTLWRVVQV